MKYLIGIDIGTSGTKTVLFDTDGNVIRSKTCGYPLYQPYNGWAEQNPEDWWNAVRETLDYVGTENVAGIGISGQMHGLVMLVVGGGAKSALWREIIAGAYGMPIQLMSSQEGAALGAAILGGVAANMYPSVETACRRLCKPSQMQESKNADEYNRIYSVYKSIYPSVKDIYKSIKNL